MTPENQKFINSPEIKPILEKFRQDSIDMRKRLAELFADDPALMEEFKKGISDEDK